MEVRPDLKGAVNFRIILILQYQVNTLRLIKGFFRGLFPLGISYYPPFFNKISHSEAFPIPQFPTSPHSFVKIVALLGIRKNGRFITYLTQSSGIQRFSIELMRVLKISLT